MNTLPEKGDKFRTKATLDTTTGMLVSEKHLECRRPDAEVTYLQYVPGHGGDVWAMEHEDGTIGVYCYTELQSVAEAEDFGRDADLIRRLRKQLALMLNQARKQIIPSHNDEKAIECLLQEADRHLN
jgi:hypothetical protein